MSHLQKAWILETTLTPRSRLAYYRRMKSEAKNGGKAGVFHRRSLRENRPTTPICATWLHELTPAEQ